MAAKKRIPGTSGSARTPSQRMLVILEQIQEQNRATIEAVQAMGTVLRREMSEMETRLTRRIEVLEMAVRQNSADIRKNSQDIRKNSEDIRKNSEDIRELRKQLTDLTSVVQTKVDESAWRSLETRVSRAEARLGL